MTYNTQHSQCSLLSSGTSGAGFKSSPPHREPTKQVPLKPRGWGVLTAASAQPGSRLSSPQALPRPESAVSSPLGAPCSLLGQGGMCGSTVVGAAQGPADRGRWEERRSRPPRGLPPALPVPRFSEVTELPGGHPGVFTCSHRKEQPLWPEQRCSSGNSLLSWCCLPVPSCLSAGSPLGTFTASSSVCICRAGAPSTPSPSLLSPLLYFSVFRCQSTWKS